MKSPIGAEIKKDEKRQYFWVDDPEYDRQRCPFCGSRNYGGGGSWSADGCLDCGAYHWFGMWFKDFS